MQFNHDAKTPKKNFKYEYFVALVNLQTAKPLSYPKLYNVLDNDETVEPTEINDYYFETNYPSISPTFFNQLNYKCDCKHETARDDHKLIILIVFTSVSSFLCILLIILIMWYKMFYKKRLLYRRDNNDSILNNFGLGVNDINDI